MEDPIMKNILIITAFCFSTSVFAHESHSKLNLRLPEGHPMKVILDGQIFTGCNGQVHFDYMSPGSHRLEVNTEPDRFSSCGQHQLIFDGRINVSECTEIFAGVSQYNGYFVECTVPLRIYYNNNEGRGRNNCEETRGWNGVGCAYAMDERSFNNLIFTLQNRAFDSSRLAIAKQTLQSNTMSSMQVAAIMQQFSFESYKLDFAKFAYRQVSDPQNYFLVNREFAFDSSVRSLDDYIHHF